MAPSACFLNYQNHLPKRGIARSGPDSSPAVINEDNAHRFAYRSVCVRHFLGLDFLFSDGFSLRRVDKTKNKKQNPHHCVLLNY